MTPPAPCPFVPMAGPEGWRLDLVPTPWVGMAAVDLLEAIANGGKPPTYRNTPPEARLRCGRWLVHVWADGSLTARPRGGIPLPFPMLLGRGDAATYPANPGATRWADLPKAWLATAFDATAARTVGRHMATLGTPGARNGAWLLWWAPGRQTPGALWVARVETLAPRVAAEAQVAGLPCAGESVSLYFNGGIPGPCTYRPAELDCTQTVQARPNHAFVRRRFAHHLGTDLSGIDGLASAYSCAKPKGCSQELPMLVPAPLSWFNVNVPTPTSHALLAAQKALACTA